MLTASVTSFRNHVSLKMAANVGAVSDKRTGDMQLAYEGTWLGHHSGNPINLTEALFAKWAREFKAHGEPLLVDYEHQTMMVGENGKPNPASGHIHDLSIRHGERGAELWARVEWTEAAAKYIRGGEYKSCSIVFMPVVDRVTGKDLGLQLTSVGLTNTPFLEGMAPIQLSFQGAGLMAKNKGAALAVDPTVEEEPAAMADDVTDETPAAELADEPPADDAAEMADEPMASPCADVIGEMMKLSGLDDAALAAKLAENMDEIMGLIGTQVEAVAASAAAPSAEVVALSASVAELKATVAKMATELKVVRDLRPATAMSSLSPEKRANAIDLSAFNPVQKKHYENLLRTRSPEAAYTLVANNPRMAR